MENVTEFEYPPGTEASSAATCPDVAGHHEVS
jgi:hypothetical protein